jgi:hypothetical protein
MQQGLRRLTKRQERHSGCGHAGTTGAIYRVRGRLLENPHATITVRGSDKVWTVPLAPISRMSGRGATERVVAIGQNISAYGYPSTAEKDELRAERITVNGKTYEMR